MLIRNLELLASGSNPRSLRFAPWAPDPPVGDPDPTLAPRSRLALPRHATHSPALLGTAKAKPQAGSRSTAPTNAKGFCGSAKFSRCPLWQRESLHKACNAILPVAPSRSPASACRTPNALNSITGFALAKGILSLPDRGKPVMRKTCNRISPLPPPPRAHARTGPLRPSPPAPPAPRRPVHPHPNEPRPKGSGTTRCGA